ncbi:MAG: O-antigen ligase family protein [Planctomycetota bacterium]
MLGKKYSTSFVFYVLIVSTLLFIPYFGLSSTIDPVLMPRFFVWALITFIVFTSLAIQLYKNPDSIDWAILRRNIFPAFLAYFIFSAISLIKAVNVTEGVYEVLKIFLSVVFLFLATVILSKNRNYIPFLVRTVIISATILSLIGFYEYFEYFFQKPGICMITGTMAQKNQFSSALFLMLPFCLYGVLGFRNYWKIISTIPMVLVLILILLNQTRSVWLGMLMSTGATIIVVLLLFMLRKVDISKETKALFFRRFSYIVIVLIVAGGIFGYLYLRSNSMNSLVDQVESIFSPKDRQNIPRVSMWRKTLEPIQDNFFFGIGAGNWKIVLPSYGLEGLPHNMFKTTYFVRPENDYIWVLSEIGIFGFILYLLIFGIIIVYVLKILTRHSNTNDKLLLTLIFFGIVGYMVISFFTFPKERIFHSMFLLLMMAIVISIYHQSLGDRKSVSRSFISALTIPSLLLILCAIIVGYFRLNAEIHTKKALAARRVQNWPVVISEIDKGYSAFATLDPMSTPLQWYRGEANFSLNNKQEALYDFKKAYKAHPYHIHVLNNLATCYELEGNHNKAIYYYKQTLKIFPQFEEVLINLGATYYNSGRYEAAYKTLLRCNPNTQNPKLEQYLTAVKGKLEGEKLRLYNDGN